MRYTVKRSVVWVYGRLWMPQCPAAATMRLSEYDIDNIRGRVEPGITRANVESWLGCNAGDFSEIIDFGASIEDGDESIDIPWESEDNEMGWHDCTYPSED